MFINAFVAINKRSKTVGDRLFTGENERELVKANKNQGVNGKN